MLKTLAVDKIGVIEELYPRSSLDWRHICRLRDAISAGAKLPPLVVDQNDRLIDGRHRLEAYKSLGVPQVSVRVHPVKDDAEFLLLAAEYNISHGKPLSPYEVTETCRKLCLNYNYSIDELARRLYFPLQRLQAWLAERTANNGSVTLKSPLARLHGGKRSLPESILELNKRSKGWDLLGSVNEVIVQLRDSAVISLIAEDEVLQTALQTLMEQIAECLNKVAEYRKEKAKRKKRGAR